MSYVTSWSFSSWDMWRECPYRYKLIKIDKLPVETSPQMLRGREVHDSIAKYLTGQGPAPAIASRTTLQTIEELRNFDDKIVEQQWGFDRQWKPTGWFTKGPRATWLRTVIDAGVLYEDTSAEVVDWKTGKNRGGYDDQLELFAIAAMRHLPSIQHVTTRLAFVDHEETVFGEYPRAELPKLIEKWEGQVAPMLADTEFNPRPSGRCRFCEFSKSNGGQCRFG